MLREININELIQKNDPVYVIMNSTVYTSEEFFDDEIRILVDEGASAAEPEEEEEPGEEEPETPPEATERPRRRGRRSNREIVAQAWAHGQNTIRDVVEFTGLDEDVVKKIIRELEEEEYV